MTKPTTAHPNFRPPSPLAVVAAVLALAIIAVANLAIVRLVGALA